MADMFSRQKRSEIMSKVRGSGNQATELRLIDIFREYKITGWRRRKPVFGKPDFTFPEARLAVFVDGCFWHGCPSHGSMPASNRLFWLRKIRRNCERDRAVNRHLNKLGWRVVRIWQHDLRHPARVARRVSRLMVRNIPKG